MLSLWRDRRGAVGVMLAVAMPALVGVLGLGVEAGLWYQTKRSMQTAADAAALAGALQRALGDVNGIQRVATHDASQNGFTAGGTATMAINYPPLSGPYTGDLSAVEVVLTKQRPRLLSVLFLGQDPTVAVRAVAAIKVTGNACVLALDPAVSGAVTVQGSTAVSMVNCFVAANSNDPTAISVGGSGSMTAESLWTPGNYYLGSSANLITQSAPQTHAWPLADPFANTTVSAPQGCTTTTARYVNKAVTLQPGVYCNGIDFGSLSVVTLEPGTYYIDSGDITVNGQATVTCDCTSATDGVTFVMTSTTSPSQIGTVTINGGADITLKAPSGDSADYPGLLFVQDRRAPLNNVNKLNGGAGMHLSGGMYFPEGTVQWSGDSSQGTNACVQLVANTVTFIGNSSIDNSGCAALGLKPVNIAGARLVE